MAEDTTYMRLTLTGVKSMVGGSEVTDMDLRFDNEVTESKIKIDDKEITLKITPVSIFFHRKIGEHNTIKTELQVTVESETDKQHASVFFALNTFFASDNVTLHRCRYDESGAEKKEVVETKDHALAEKYQVVSIEPAFKARDTTGYTFTVTLNIASWDYRMGLTRYSHAYTARKLGDKIMKSMVRNVWGLTEQAQGESDAVDDYCDVSGMRVLYPEVGSTHIEVMQPYLVQYNETDYEFLLRNANRCGEFFYFEDGKLHLGLYKYMKNNAETETMISNAMVSAVHSDVCLNGNANLFYQNAFKKTSSAQPSSTDKPFVAEYSNNDYFLSIPKEGYDSQESWEGLYPAKVFRIFSEIFRMDRVDIMSIYDVVNNSVLEVNRLTDTWSESANDKYKDKYFLETAVGSAQTQYSKDADSYSQFSDLYGVASKSGEIKEDNQPSTKTFYDKAEAAKRVAQQQYLIHDDVAGKDHWLGQIVTLDGVTETVVDSAGQSTQQNKRFIVVQIDCETKYEDTKRVSNYTKLTIIPDATVPTPLPANVSHVVKSGAQPAVVTDATDPRRIGRVRVRYHWQSDDSDATPWIRVTTPFSSWKPVSKDGDDDTGDGGAGMFNQLNKGDEVMVDYESENIERPYVVGSLFGGNRQDYGRQTPFGSRGYSHILRSRYGHMIGIREPNNSTGIVTSLFPGLKLFSFIPGFSTMVQEEPSEKVRQGLGGFEICDNNGLYSISASSDARKISVSSPFGTVNIDAAMGITVSAPNGNIKIVGKNVDIIAGNNLTLKSGENISNSFLTGSLPSYIFDSSKSAGAKTGHFFKERLAKPLMDSIVGAFDVPALRFMIEVLIKPVQGTLKIHSGRHLMLEAGGKEAAMPASTFKRHYYPDAGDRFTQFNNLKADILIPLAYVRACIHAYVKAYKEGRKLKVSIAQYITRIHGVKAGLTAQATVENELSNLIVSDHFNEENVRAFLFDGNIENDNEKKKKASTVFEKLNKVRGMLDEKNYKPWRRPAQYFNVKQEDGDVFHNPTILLKSDDNDVKKFNIEISNEYDRKRLLKDNYLETIRTKIRTIIGQYMSVGSNHNLLLKVDYSTLVGGDNTKWTSYVNGLRLDPAYDDEGLGFRDYVRKDVGLKLANKIVPVDTIQFLSTWNPESKGQILYSYPDKPNRLLGGDDNKCVANDTDLEGFKQILRGDFIDL